MSELLERDLGKFAKKLPKVGNIFLHSPSIHRYQSFSRKVSSLKMLSEHVGNYWLPFCELFTEGQNMFRSESEDEMKNFPKKNFPSKCSSKHGESIFDNFTEKFVPNVREKFAQNLNTDQKQKIGKIRIFKRFSERVENSLDKLSVVVLPKVRQGKAHGPEKMRKCFWKDFFYQSVPLKS